MCVWGGGGGGIKCNGSVWPRTQFTFGIKLCMVSIIILILHLSVMSVT